ncbi:Cation/H(+) antiporter 15 [Camellia lanceoleosa]|uniref:Cation/H(+) antiporter 15 n=1 Tax=Camellia lanceoleosa TaxID=1840588 RepID=A0ACC0HBF7_9ERIC|nr:Cation/H(+) antiporter 15 [Camellia lanceoleosa]
MNNDPDKNQQWIAGLTSSTSFQVTSLLLEDVKLLNSEIGRLAMSSSLISSCSCWTFRNTRTFLYQASAFHFTTRAYFQSQLPRLLLIMTIVFVLRPFMFRMMKKIPEGYQAYFGAMILGLAMPPGPPLGAGLLEKLEIFISAVLLPAYIVDAGRYVDVYTINMATFGRTGVLIMLIKIDIYSIIMIMTVLNAAIGTPVICHLYNPSKRYMNYKRRTIQQSIHESEFRIVLCIHEEDQVFSLMNLLNVSHPTHDRPIRAFVLDLMELVGRDHPVLINHRPQASIIIIPHQTDRIINALHHHELSREGR